MRSKRKNYKAYWVMIKSKLNNLDKLGKLYQTTKTINQCHRQKRDLKKQYEQ